MKCSTLEFPAGNLSVDNETIQNPIILFTILFCRWYTILMNGYRFL
jgi:hypothetical protein